jgi:hypothetical protein
MRAVIQLALVEETVGGNKKAASGRIFISILAEPEGFEPSMRLYTPYSLSRGAPSATRSQFQRLQLCLMQAR